MDHSPQLENITENDLLFVATFSKDKGSLVPATILLQHLRVNLVLIPCLAEAPAIFVFTNCRNNRF